MQIKRNGKLFGIGWLNAMSDNASSELALTSATLSALVQNIATAAEIASGRRQGRDARCLKAFEE